MNELIQGLLLGIIVSAITYGLIELIKSWFAERRRLINEFNYVVNISLEIIRAIERCEYYIQLAIKKQTSLSKLYSGCYDKSLVELVKISSLYRAIDKMNYIYSIFYFVNYNIDVGRPEGGVGFIKDHLLKIYDSYNYIKEISDRRKTNWTHLIFLTTPKEFIKISQCRIDNYTEKISQLK